MLISGVPQSDSVIHVYMYMSLYIFFPFFSIIEGAFWDFPGGPVVETSPSNAGSVGSIPGGGDRIPHASGPKKPKTEAIL